MTSDREPSPDVVALVRTICAPLVGSVEHEAWSGVSWRVGGVTFAHVVQIADGRPPAYRRGFATAGPATVVTFQAGPDDYHALAAAGPPFHHPRWRPGIVGVVVEPATDWQELAELLTDSHSLCRDRGRRRF